jgi:hypothetical protein
MTLLEQGRGAAWHVWINEWHIRGTVWERHGRDMLCVNPPLFWLSKGKPENIQEIGTANWDASFWKCMKESIWYIRLKSLFSRGIKFMNSMKEKMGDHIVPSTEFIWWRKASACLRASHFLCISLLRRKRNMKFLWQRKTDIALTSDSQDLKDFVKWKEKMQQTHSYRTLLEKEFFVTYRISRIL